MDVDISNSAAIAFSKINASLSITDAHISGSASISGSKIANASITSDKINQSNNWTFSQLTSTTANIRDVSATNVEVSGNIVPLRNITSNLGSSLKRWNSVFVNDLSVNTINGQAYTGSSGGGSSTVLTSVASDIIPSVTNTYSLGSTTRYWNNSYINNLRVSNRVYQEISGDISWSAINGYYALTKDAYPSLNPLSTRVKALQTWTNRNIAGTWSTVCWSPKLGIFLAISKTSSSNNIITSNNGIVWNIRTLAARTYSGNYYAQAYVCWSPELEIFVAVAGTETNNIMYSSNGTSWSNITAFYDESVFRCISWSPQLGLFVIIVQNREFVYTSKDGITWSQVTIIKSINDWVPQIVDMCWCAELGIFVAVGDYNDYRIITSKDGTYWNFINAGLDHAFTSICWSKELGLFVVVSHSGTNRVSISNNGTQWTHINIGTTHSLWSVAWSPQLGLFIAGSNNNTILTSPDGIKWSVNSASGDFLSACWSPELGIFVAVGNANTIVTSSLKGRPPTSYNVFDSSFNNIDQTGKWTFSNMAVTTLTVTSSFTNNSDDRLKHNEVIINNGLEVIDQLTPKFYQKTLDMLDAHYYGDLSGHTWIYEAGLIAQEVLQVPDLSFAVSGGDYYESVMRYDLSYNDISNNDTSYNFRPPITRTNYYEVSKNLIKQSYGLNYTSVFVYGLAAIKELHQKVKAQETSILSLQTAMLEQQATINSLLTRLQALETSAN
jgi:hypothetical protein